MRMCEPLLYITMFQKTRVDCGAQTIVRDINVKACRHGHKPGGEEVNWEEETRHDVIIIGVSYTSGDSSCGDGPP